MSINKIQYKQSGKYFEFYLNGELKERATEFSTLTQKVKKYKLDYENQKKVTPIQAIIDKA